MNMKIFNMCFYLLIINMLKLTSESGTHRQMTMKNSFPGHFAAYCLYNRQ